MNNLVFIKNDRALTDSLTIAETFGKEHRRVLQDIRELECSREFNKHNFVLIYYKDSMNREKPQFLITQDGFSFLVMGYTGTQAARFKEMYINEFNRMKQELIDQQKPSYEIDDRVKRATKWIEEEKERQQLQETIEQQQPKVSFADACLASNDSILIRELAKLATDQGLNIGQNRLYKKLRQWGYILRYSTEPTQRAMDAGYFEVIQRIHQTPDGSKLSRTTKVTPKGQLQIINRLKKELSLQFV